MAETNDLDGPKSGEELNRLVATGMAAVGLGGIGLRVILGATMTEARRIIAVDINSSKFEIESQ